MQIIAFCVELSYGNEKRRGRDGTGNKNKKCYA